MGHARGVIIMSAGLNKIPVYDYQPTRAKNVVTGSGRADKTQVMNSVAKILNNKNLLKNETQVHSLLPSGNLFNVWLERNNSYRRYK